MNTTVKLPGLELDFPLYNGSGSYEYGDYQWLEMNFASLPALTLKTSTIKSKITPEKRQNLMTKKGTQIFNSIGLQNPDITGVIKRIKEIKNETKLPLIASASGDSVPEFVENVRLLAEQDVEAVEINLSCPNIDKGGIAYGTSPKLVEEVVRAIKKEVNKPIYVKLTPNVTDIVAIAKAAERGGADAIIAINTMLGFVCDSATGKPLISRGYGGYSGPSIFPIALRAIHQIYQAINIPIIGVGGISTAQDVIDMMSAGAQAVQVVSSIGENKNIFKDIRRELPILLGQINIKDVNDIVGRSHKFKLKDLFPNSYLDAKVAVDEN